MSLQLSQDSDQYEKTINAPQLDERPLEIRIQEAYQNHADDVQDKLSIKTEKRQSSKEFKVWKKSYDEYKKGFESVSQNLQNNYNELLNTSETLTAATLQKEFVEAKLEALDAIEKNNEAQKQKDQLSIQLTKLDTLITQSTEQQTTLQSTVTTQENELQTKKQTLDTHLTQYESLVTKHYQSQLTQGMEQINSWKVKYLTLANNTQYTQAQQTLKVATQKFGDLKNSINTVTVDDKPSLRAINRFDDKELTLIDQRRDAQVVTQGYELIPYQYDIARAKLQYDIATTLNQENTNTSQYLQVFEQHNQSTDRLFDRKLQSYKKFNETSKPTNGVLSGNEYRTDKIFVKAYASYMIEKVQELKPEALQFDATISLSNFVDQAKNYYDYTKTAVKYLFQRNIKVFITGMRDTYKDQIDRITKDLVDLKNEQVTTEAKALEYEKAENPTAILRQEGIKAGARKGGIKNAIINLTNKSNELYPILKELNSSFNSSSNIINQPSNMVDKNSIPEDFTQINFSDITKPESPELEIPFIKQLNKSETKKN